MTGLSRFALSVAFLLCLAHIRPHLSADEPVFTEPIDVKIPHVSTDASIQYDYDIVYVRAGRAGDEVHKRYYTDFSQPVTMEPGADLMLLHPDGTEELLVAGGEGAITDPFVSFDGQWVYYTHIYNLKDHSQWNPPREGADIYKLHVPTRRIVRLTNQRFAPNTGAAEWSSDFRSPQEGRTHIEYGVFNMGPCPLPGGKIVFTSNRDAFRPAKGYPAIALQLFVMDDRDTDIGEEEDPVNLEKIGHLNISGALHPVVLTDGRIMFSTLESQGIRSDILWGVWTIHPDGANWQPLVSAFDPGSAPNGFHFQTQLSDGSIIVEQYYNQNNSGFGSYVKLPPSPPEGYPAFGPAYMDDSRNKPWRYGRFENGRPKWYRMPFMPTGSISLTPFSHGLEGPADASMVDDPNSPKVGKFTHPSGAPDNHLLTVYSPGPVNHQYTFLPQLDGGIYLLKGGEVIDEPAELRLIKNDPQYNECWPRAVVPYGRIYGVDEPHELPRLANDGQASPHLPEGTPFGLVGTSSLYKRESASNGRVPEGSVTAKCADENDPWRGLGAMTSHGNGMPLAWHNQGGDTCLYSNDEIHAIRIVAMEPTTDRHRGPRSGRLFYSHAQERLRVLGEIPVRKFIRDANGHVHQPLDPDGNPDTSFLAKIPADTAFTFQTIDRDGMVLSMAQTWHQLRPGEVRTNCGGCHAHSQPPTDFALTAAAQPDYKVWDLVNTTPLIVDRPDQQTLCVREGEPRKQWDTDNATSLGTESRAVVNVEYHRDIRPILDRHCVACHTAKDGREPAGNLNLDADDEAVDVPNKGRFPGTYARLAVDEAARFGHPPVGYDSWGYPNASRYVRMFQSRRSLLAWKIHGKRLDGFSNDDHPSESRPGAGDLSQGGQSVDFQHNRARWDLNHIGTQMPPPEAVAKGDVPPLSDEEKRALVRWIDLGCPIDLDYDPSQPERRGFGWMGDDNRPIISITYPQPGENREVSRIVVGLFDYDSGLDGGSLEVTADFEIDGVAAGTNLASRFERATQGVWMWKLGEPLSARESATLTVSARDHQGNAHRVARTFSIGGDKAGIARQVMHGTARGASPSAAGRRGSPPAEQPAEGLSRHERPTAPERVHVAEDYETDIERRWWMRGEPEVDNVPPSLSRHIPDRRACRATATKDFDDLMGDPQHDYKAVIFNPVPGPPMGANTRLSFRYWLDGTDSIRVQIYSLTNGYHRRLVLTDLPQRRWESATVDMTLARRPDGSGGPLSADERIDDIQFYIEPSAELVIDDIVLYEATPADDADTQSAAQEARRLFPARVMFTGWFDTGQQGKEWPGRFEIVPHEPPRSWKAARSVLDEAAGRQVLRLDLRGRRPLGKRIALRFRYQAQPGFAIAIQLLDSHTGHTWTRGEIRAASGQWAEAETELTLVPAEHAPEATSTYALFADQLLFTAERSTAFTIDDVLLYELSD